MGLGLGLSVGCAVGLLGLLWQLCELCIDAGWPPSPPPCGCAASTNAVLCVVCRRPAGPILAQAMVPVYPTDRPEQLAARVLREEHRLYPRCVAALCEDRVTWRADGIPIMCAGRRFLASPALLCAALFPVLPRAHEARGCRQCTAWKTLLMPHAPHDLGLPAGLPASASNPPRPCRHPSPRWSAH